MWGQLFTNTLNGWQWGLMLAIPPCLVALYFLKLRREPVVMSSTYLWRHTIEDLHVNSLWQKLRQNLLLWMQLMLVALLMLACLRPGCRSRTILDQRIIFLLDHSASMNATDVEPTRFEAARKQIGELIDQMDSGDVAMLVSFSDQARIAQRFTSDRGLLRRKLARIQRTSRRSNIEEALRLAAGLANPGRSGEADTGDLASADPLPADVILFSDGRLQGVPEFSWGNLKPRFVRIGNPTAANIAITAFSAARSPERAEALVVLAELSNFGAGTTDVTLSLYLDDELIDASATQVEVGGTQGIEFTIEVDKDCSLRAELSSIDDLSLDDVAFLSVNRPRTVRVLLVTPGNEPLRMAMGTEHLAELADVSTQPPEYLGGEDYQKNTDAGLYDFIIYDRCQPVEMPQANTMFIHSVPPHDGWSAEPEREAPQILDVAVEHPLMQYVALGDVTIASGHALKYPPGGRTLFASEHGPLCVVSPRAAFQDLVVGFEWVGVDADGQTYANTDWHIRTSYPVFLRNSVQMLGGARAERERIQLRPGDTATLASSPETDQLRVLSPSGKNYPLTRQADHRFLLHDTAEIGIYKIHENDSSEPTQSLAVNLCDENESNLMPIDIVKTAWDEIPAQTQWATARWEGWRPILLVATALLLAEWWIYNQRVYL